MNGAEALLEEKRARALPVHQEWIDRQLELIKGAKERFVNPCMKVYGPGPEGAKCKSCKSLYGVQFAKVYHKCKLRKETRGPGSDHRVNWPACGKYEVRT